jgi:uncharacterized repeat protein (TIGR03803 family)
MTRSKLLSGSLAILAATTVFFFLSSARAATPNTQTIYTFTGDRDGEYLDTDLVIDKRGNLYGTTVQGGNGSGTIFRLSPNATGWKHTVLYNFTGGRDGGEPYKGVTLDSKGNLYGTAVAGGNPVCGCGVVYRLSRSGGKWVQTVLHTFKGTDGSGPGSPVIFDKAGNIYGMAPTGGSFGFGVVFQLKLHTNGAYGYRILHNFAGGTDGASGSAGRLLFDASGNIFGVSTAGGTAGAGVAWELSPTRSGEWTETILHEFGGQPDAVFPYGGLVFDAAGNLYGTSYYGGATNWGAVYKLTNTNGTWTESVLYSFAGGPDGANPVSALLPDNTGRHFYGTNSAGGAACGCGTIFKITLRQDGTVTETVAHRFLDTAGGSPYNTLVPDALGNLYGTLAHGGPSGDGLIFKFVP